MSTSLEQMKAKAREELQIAGCYVDETLILDEAMLDYLIEAAYNARTQEVVETIKAVTTHVLPLPEDAKDYMGDFERGTVGGGAYVKRIILEALSPEVKDDSK